MFFLNIGYRKTFVNQMENLRGIVYLPSAEGADRMGVGIPGNFRSVLLDPQMYLWDLNAADCGLTCVRLASHPWFGIEITELDLSEPTKLGPEGKRRASEILKRQWRRPLPTGAALDMALRRTLEAQLRLNCTHIILPTPLITDREDEAAVPADWLDRALALAQEMEIGLPLLATVAVAEGVLAPAALEDLGLLDTIVDQVRAREGIDGAYIVVAQTHAGHPFETSDAVARAYLRLVTGFKRSGLDTIVTNFADVFGLACMGGGAWGMATGPSQRRRRLSLENFRDLGGGRAFPQLYSHPLIGELYTESDLVRIGKLKLLRRVSDESPYSRSLLDQLRKGRPVAELPDWAESQNNVGAATNHFLFRLNSETDALGKILDRSERAERIRSWLQDAEANVVYLLKKLGDTPLKGRLAPSERWLQAFDERVSF